MTRLEQLERMVEVLRGALHDVEAVDYPYYPETRRICGESLSLADRIASEPVELSQYQPPICNDDPGPWCGTCARCRAQRLIAEIEREL